VTGGNPNAVKAEASFLTADQPGLFLPNPDQVVVWKTSVSGPQASFASLTQFYLNAELWWLTG
jgi:peptide/nickel transport system substrate-binding protein